MRISNLTQVNRIQSSVNNLQVELSKAEEQISTGKISSSYSGLKGENARISVQLREAMESRQSYIDTIKTTRLRAEVTDAALVQIQDLASDLRVELIRQPQDVYIEDLPIMNEFAKTQIDRLANLLNSEVAGRFIFSGVNSGTAPIVDTATMKANFSNAVSDIAGDDLEICNLEFSSAICSKYLLSSTSSLTYVSCLPFLIL